MTIYETIKAAISVKQAAEHYGLKVHRNGMACCPFHNDRHPSLKLNEDYFFCFGCGAKENRYLQLLNKVIRAGVKTKVLMLSATPVNNRFYDLKNQLAIAYEGNQELINDKLNTTKPIEEIFRQAQKAFNAWSKLEAKQRTTDNLLKTLDFDFFEVLDSVTIARSRKHIEKYYNSIFAHEF